MAPSKVTISTLLSPSSSPLPSTSTGATATTSASSPPPPPSNTKVLLCKWENCNEVFDESKELYAHLCDFHIGRKCNKNLSLCCKWDNCSTVTIKRDHITSHIRVHIPFKPYNCKLCQKTFKRPQDLKKHEKTHINNEIKKRQKQLYDSLSSLSSFEKSKFIKEKFDNFENFYNTKTNKRSFDDENIIPDKRKTSNNYHLQHLLAPHQQQQQQQQHKQAPPVLSPTFSAKSPMSSISAANSELQSHPTCNSHTYNNHPMYRQFFPPPPPPPQQQQPMPPVPSHYPVYLYPQYPPHPYPYQHQQPPPVPHHYEQFIPTYHQYIQASAPLQKLDSTQPNHQQLLSVQPLATPVPLLTQNDIPDNQNYYSRI